MKIAVIAVHPDDETLAMGGTILKHKSEGDEVYWVICTGEVTDEIVEVGHLYDLDGVRLMHLPETELDNYPFGDIVSGFLGVFTEIQPDIVYLPFKGDIHTDHQVAFKAAFSCTKWFRYPSIKKVLMMETISETDFSDEPFMPNCFVDISDYMEKKKEIMKVYSSELGDHPFPRTLENIEALAHLRGSQSGFKYAESFMILKELI